MTAGPPSGRPLASGFSLDLTVRNASEFHPGNAPLDLTDTEEVTGSNPVAPTTHRRSSAAHSHSPAAPTGSPATRFPSNFPATSGLVARPASTAATTRARISPCCGAVSLATHVGLAAVRPTSSSGPADASPGSAAGRRRRARAALGGQPAGGVLLRLPTAWRVAHSRRTHPPGRTLHPRCTALLRRESSGC